MNRYRKLLGIALLDILLLLVMAIGIDLRTKQAHKYLTINTATFFYERAAHLNEKGVYPEVDATSSAPGIRAEDYPPGLAYASVWAYRMTKPLHGYNFYEFVCVFPVLMYVIILLASYWFIRKLYSVPAALVFALIITVLPAGVKLTSSLYFTSESVGILMFLVSVFFVIKIEERPLLYTLLSVISVTLFTLTYQLFLPLLVIIAATALTRIKRKELALAYLSVLVIPLVIGHIVSRGIVGINYSPFSVFHELFIAFRESKTEHYKIAMGRTKLKPTDFIAFTENFGWITIPLITAGVISCVRNIRKTAYFMPLFGCLVSILLVSYYFKYRFIALPLIVWVSAIGWDFLWNLIKKPDNPVSIEA